MNYTIIGDTDCPLVQIRLQRDETVRIERGCMAYMSDVELTGKMNTNKKGIGGMFSAFSDQRGIVLHHRGAGTQRCRKAGDRTGRAGQDRPAHGRRRKAVPAEHRRIPGL